MTLKGPANNIAMLCDGKTADAAIFNMDSPNARKIFMEEMHEYPQRPAIVMSIRDPGIHNAFYLPKPVRINDIIQAISYCRENSASVVSARSEHGLSEAERTATSATNNSSTSVYDKYVGKTLFEGHTNKNLVSEMKSINREKTHYYDPRDSIQGILTHAMEECLQRQTTIRLGLMSGGDIWESIVFLYDERKVYYSMNDANLAQLCTTPLCLIRYSLRRHKDRKSRFGGAERDIQGRYLSFEAFTLKVALWASSGRVPVGTDLSRPVMLKRWPNLTRLPEIPHAMPISALLIDRPQPLPLVAKVLGLPQRQVFTFYCAALSLGLIDLHSKSAPVEAAQSERKRHHHHTLFGNILKRLRKAHA